MALLPPAEAHARALMARLTRIRSAQPGASILEVGSGAGRTTVGLARQGYRVGGVEPWDEARRVAARLAEHEGVEIEVLEGVAEKLPVPAGAFDFVIANSVLEHVDDPRAAMAEAYRVLKPGGLFWFSSASVLCPRQNEIDGFPCFPWYPDRLKRRIMQWAKVRRPHLVGHTQTPAIHWWTPRKACRMLRETGFRGFYDRWDLRLPAEGGRLYRAALRVIRVSRVTKLVADILVSACAFAALK